MKCAPFFISSYLINQIFANQVITLTFNKCSCATNTPKWQQSIPTFVIFFVASPAKYNCTVDQNWSGGQSLTPVI